MDHVIPDKGNKWSEPFVLAFYLEAIFGQHPGETEAEHGSLTK